MTEENLFKLKLPMEWIEILPPGYYSLKNVEKK